MAYKRKADAEERRFMAWVMEKPCCVPDCNSPSIFHHEKQRYPLPRRDHKFGANICDPHHRELHGKDFGWNVEVFAAIKGINTIEVAEANREEYFGEND